MEVGEYKTLNIGYGQLKVMQLMDLKIGDCVYILFKNNCIELRDRLQYSSLLARLDKKIATINDDKERKKIERYRSCVISYSKVFVIPANRDIYLGIDVVNRYNLFDGAILEKCADCIKLCNPSVFKSSQDDRVNGRCRR